MTFVGNDNSTNGVNFEIGNNNKGANAYTWLGFTNDGFDSVGTYFTGVGLNSSIYSNTGFGTGLNVPSEMQIISNIGGISLGSGTTTSNGYVRFFTGGFNAANERMRINSNGYIGIGTTTPTSLYALTIASTTAPQLSISGSGGFSQWVFRNVGGLFALATTTVNGTATSSVSALTIDQNGLVNINGLTLGIPLGATSGGTGQSAITQGDLLYGSASNVWSRLADVATGSYLASGGVTANPTWTATTTGFPNNVSSGRTGATIFTAGQLLIGNAASAITQSANLFFNTALSYFGVASSTPNFGFSIGTTTVQSAGQFAQNIASTTAAQAGATINLNWETIGAGGGNAPIFILHQNTLINLDATSSNPRDGAFYTPEFCQDHTGGRILTWGYPIIIRYNIPSGSTSAATTTITATPDQCTALLLRFHKYVGPAGIYEQLASSTVPLLQ